MFYDVSLLSSAADCENLIQEVDLERGELKLRKNALMKQLAAIGKGSDQIPSAIGVAVAQIEVLEKHIPTMPDGSEKKATDLQLLRLRLRLSNLERRAEDYDVFNRVETGYEIAKFDAQIAAADAFIEALTARMNELAQAA